MRELPTSGHESLSRRQTRGASLLPPGNLYRRRPHPRTLLHGPGLRAPGHPTKPLPAPLAESERTQGSQVRDCSEWHFLVAEQAQVISQPHKRIPKARITSRELHPSTRPLRARRLCGCRWPGRRVGEGRPTGEGARRDPPSTAQTWFGVLRPSRVVTHAQPTRTAAGRPASDAVSTLRQLAPAPAGKAAASGGRLQSKKGPGAFQFPAAARGAAPRPRGRAPPPHLHTARPPRATRPAGAACPPYLHTARPLYLHIALEHPKGPSHAQLTDFRTPGAEALRMQLDKVGKTPLRGS